MKNLIKPIFVILVTGTLLLSTTVISFAGEWGDPLGGKSIVVPKYNYVII